MLSSRVFQKSFEHWSLLRNVMSSKVWHPALSTTCATVLPHSVVRHHSTKKPGRRAPAYRIGVTQAQIVQHTGSLFDSHDASDRLMDDIMIRKYVEGVFYDMLQSDIIIKRRDNRIFIHCIVKFIMDGQKLYFLVGFSEKLLTELFGCITKFEIQTLGNPPSNRRK